MAKMSALLPVIPYKRKIGGSLQPVTEARIRAAFRRGVKDGEKGWSRGCVPFANFALAEAWERGFDVGITRRQK